MKERIAKAIWEPYKKEKESISGRVHYEEIDRVDQIWPWLSENHGSKIAIDAPHAFSPETVSYKELSLRIELAAAAFKSLDVKPREVVALFSENSPRWLVVDQGIMRAGACDAVRGATAPVEELKYILEDSGAIGLIIQSAELLSKLQLDQEKLSRLKFILQLEGDASEGVVSWEDFIYKGTEYKKQLLINPETNAWPDNSAILTGPPISPF